MAGITMGSVRMRKADSAKEDFHLLEELSKPLASLNAGRIALWVYRTGPLIREIVLAGHAESQTCSSATSAIIEAAKRLDDSVEWMLTCGAAYFRVKSSPAGVPDTMLSIGNQGILSEMLRALSELAEETGLVQIMPRDWNDLDAFRRRYRRRSSEGRAVIALPLNKQPPVADYVPIIPFRSASGSPLVFHLEGWDFDCPEFQAVADLHLRKVRRELLKDALRRRARYRDWLKGKFVEKWARQLKWLRKTEAEQLRVDVPGPMGDSDAPSQPTDVKTFFEDRLKEFLDPCQTWYRDVVKFYNQAPFAQSKDEDLDQKIRPPTVNVLDFEQGISTERPATAEDEYTRREQITQSYPGLISTCLRYIRRMDAIIKPYEDLRLWQRGVHRRAGGSSRPTREEQEAACVSEVSRRIVIETMIRGWPSFYLDDEADQAVFDAWANEYRPRVWSMMARQAEAAGVAVDLLLEDNVVYDVRFDEDLGCTMRPLMLADNASHAQIHGSRAGASAVVPLWPRHAVRSVPKEVISAGTSNRQRAGALIEQARKLTSGAAPDLARAATCLRLALGCHPGEAGKRILAEWSRRLGRDTRSEFELASEIVYARELCGRLRFAEADKHLKVYLAQESRPARNALALAALCEIMAQEESGGGPATAKGFTEMRRKAARLNDLREHLTKEAGKKLDTLTESEFISLAMNKPQVRRILDELKSLKDQIDKFGPQAEEAEALRRELITKAMNSPASVRKKFPAVALAAEECPEKLKEVLDCQCRFVPNDIEMVRRYGDVAKVVEMRAVFTHLHRLSDIRRLAGSGDEDSRRRAVAVLQEMLTEPWLPEPAELNLRKVEESYRSGKWDRMLANLIGYSLQDAMSVCYMRIQDLLSDPSANAVPLAELLATRIHIAQTVDGKYLKSLGMLLDAHVGLGRAVRQPWTVLNAEIIEMPPDGKLDFDLRHGVISLTSAGKTVPLVQAPSLAPGEAEYVTAILADPQMPQRVNRFAESLAEGLLAVEVQPQPAWLLWRDAMQAAGAELLFTIALFGYDASPMPELAPPKGKRGEEMEQRLDRQTPRLEPTVDLEWRDLDGWAGLVGPNTVRKDEAHGV